MLKIAELRTVLERILDHIKTDLEVDSVALEHNFYWDPTDEWRFSVNEDPGTLGIGSLVDDWEFCSSLLDPDRQPVSLLLTHLAPLLHYVGIRIGQ